MKGLLWQLRHYIFYSLFATFELARHLFQLSHLKMEDQSQGALPRHDGRHRLWPVATTPRMVLPASNLFTGFGRDDSSLVAELLFEQPKEAWMWSHTMYSVEASRRVNQ
jgi:hypothetical protein